jgi:hypothetical protein
MHELAHALLCDGEVGLGARAALLMLARISPTSAGYIG